MANLPRDQRRAEIIEAAIHLVGQGGLSSATVRGVAQVLQASPGQIHHHFASADALRAEAFRELTRRSLAQSDAVLAPLDPMRRVMALLGCAETGAEHPIGQSLCRDAIEVARLSEDLRVPMREALTAWSERIAAACEAARAQGQLPPGMDTQALATALVLVAAGSDLLGQIGAVAAPRQSLTDAVQAQIALHVAAALSGAISAPDKA